VIVVATVVIVFIFAKPIAAEMAERKILFFSPRKARIVAKMRSNAKIGYYGGDMEDKFVDEKTGELKDKFIYVEKEEKNGKKVKKILVKTDEFVPEYAKMRMKRKSSLLYTWLGVFWLGFDRLFTYWFSKDVQAESVYLKNVVTLKIYKILTKEMAEVDLEVVFDLETVNAALSLNYENGAWMQKIMAAIESAVRETFAQLTYVEVVAGKVELSKKGSKKDTFKLLENILSLNDSEAGNTGLIEAVGQMITGFHVTALSVEEEIEKISKAPAIAEGQKKASIIESEGKSTAIKNVGLATAEAITAEGNARIAIVKELVNLVGKDNAANMEIEDTRKESSVDTAEKLAHGLEKTNASAVSFGGEMGFMNNITKKEKKAVANEGEVA
jgi:hypothetical protein